MNSISPIFKSATEKIFGSLDKGVVIQYIKPDFLIDNQGLNQVIEVHLTNNQHIRVIYQYHQRLLYHSDLQCLKEFFELKLRQLEEVQSSK